MPPHSTLHQGEDINMRKINVTPLHRVTALFVAGMLASLNPAFAADGKTTEISGDAVTSDCAAAKSASFGQDLTGSLRGCLAIFIRHTNCRELNGFALYTELGREEFEGKL